MHKNFSYNLNSYGMFQQFPNRLQDQDGIQNDKYTVIC